MLNILEVFTDDRASQSAVLKSKSQDSQERSTDNIKPKTEDTYFYGGSGGNIQRIILNQWNIFLSPEEPARPIILSFLEPADLRSIGRQNRSWAWLHSYSRH